MQFGQGLETRNVLFSCVVREPNTVGNSFRKRLVTKETRTKSLLTADLHIPDSANMGQIICANVAALRVDWDCSQRRLVQSLCYFSSLCPDSVDLQAALNSKAKAKLCEFWKLTQQMKNVSFSVRPEWILGELCSSLALRNLCSRHKMSINHYFRKVRSLEMCDLHWLIFEA